jgi:hypothetical protein
MYLFSSLESVEERDLLGSPVRAGSRTHVARSLVPGIGLGLVAKMPMGNQGLCAEVDVRLHMMIGAAGSLYRVATMTLGIGG